MEKLTSQEIQALILKLVMEHKHGKDNWNTALVRAVEIAHVQCFERAAKAIVLECCEQARDEVQSILDWDKADQVVARIKEHFGVAE